MFKCPVRPFEDENELGFEVNAKRPRTGLGEDIEREGAAVAREDQANRGIEEHEESSEAQRSIGMSTPIAPSAQEKEEHERTHIPYRVWCDVCVQARGHERKHGSRAAPLERYRIPQLTLDYWFMGGESPLE